MLRSKLKGHLYWFFDIIQKKGIPTNPEDISIINSKDLLLQNHSPDSLVQTEDIILLSRMEIIFERHLSESDYNVRSLSREMCISYESMNSSTKRINGCSPKQYLNKYRMNRAYDMIVSTGLTISEICYAVGSSSLQTFSRSFKREFGISPRQLERNTAS